MVGPCNDLSVSSRPYRVLVLPMETGGCEEHVWTLRIPGLRNSSGQSRSSAKLVNMQHSLSRFCVNKPIARRRRMIAEQM